VFDADDQLLNCARARLVRERMEGRAANALPLHGTTPLAGLLGFCSERFIRAQERAVAVQIYISKRFGLQPNTIGVMPMSDPTPSSVGKSVWDGVSLVLIR
jgi:hypothetical protein